MSSLIGSQRAAPPSVDAALAAIAAAQHGLVTVVQLAEVGLTTAAVRKRVVAGRLHRVHRRVYAVGHARLSQEGRWLAAVLTCGDTAALSHLSAARLWKIWRRAVIGCDVVSVHRHGRGQRGVQLHTCRRLDPRDVTSHRGIPVTTVARTLVDLSDVMTAEQLANVIHEAAFRRRFDVAATQAAMTRANGRHNLRVLERALSAHSAGSAGTRSGLEDMFLAIVRSCDLPDPQVNVRLEIAERPIEVDFHWPEIGLCVEIDGPGHSRPRTLHADDLRDRALNAAGYELVRLTHEDLALNLEAVVARLRRSHDAW